VLPALALTCGSTSEKVSKLLLNYITILKGIKNSGQWNQTMGERLIYLCHAFLRDKHNNFCTGSLYNKIF